MTNYMTKYIEGNPTKYDIFNYLSSLLSRNITRTYDKIKNKIRFATKNQ